MGGKEGRLSSIRPIERFIEGSKVGMKTVGMRGEDAEETSVTL